MYCVCADWPHSEGIDEDEAVVFYSKEEAIDDYNAIKSQGATDVRLFEMVEIKPEDCSS